jgi:hypothetical protein
MWWIRQLFSPLTYLRIRLGPGRIYRTKRFYDFVLPTLFGALTSLGYFSLHSQPALLGEHGLLNSISGLLQLLVAFFIAALAAVATFDRDTMELPLRGSPALRSRWSNERQMDVDKNLTRRQFICHLFGYLSFVALMLFLSTIAANAVWPELSRSLSVIAQHWFKVILSTIFWVVLWNIVIQTVVGLYFLGDRMQHDD